MKPNIRIPPLTAAFAVIILASRTTVQGADGERSEHQEWTATSGRTLTFKAVAGSIDVQTQDQDKVTYDATVKPGKGRTEETLDQLEFVYANEDGNVTITMQWKDGQQPRNVNLNARHTLVVPKRYSLSLKTAAGAITAGDLQGTVTAQTGGGNVRVGNVEGGVKVRTSGGNIMLSSVKGDAEIETAGGKIETGSVSGELKGRTSGGSISAELEKQNEKPVELSTAGGNIRLVVPEDFKANLVASTAGGQVTCDLPFEGSTKRQSIKGQVNGGGPKVELKTSGGNINVAKR